MSVKFENKIVFVTGASAGIGRATALAFAKLGAKLVLCARRMDKLRELEPEMRAAGSPAVHLFELDVRDRAKTAAAIEAIPPEFADVDVLVNNAGLSRGLKKLWEDDIDNWEEMIDTNVKGLLYVTRAVVPGMVQRGSGHVINLGSIAGHFAYPNGAVYCASKGAERLITDGLRIDLNGTPIRVTSVDPGMVETDFSLVRFRGDADRAAQTYKDINPLTPEDVADSIVWAATRPAHMQVQTIVLTPVMQANPFVITRRKL